MDYHRNEILFFALAQTKHSTTCMRSKVINGKKEKHYILVYIHPKEYIHNKIVVLYIKNYKIDIIF